MPDLNRWASHSSLTSYHYSTTASYSLLQNFHWYTYCSRINISWKTNAISADFLSFFGFVFQEILFPVVLPGLSMKFQHSSSIYYKKINDKFLQYYLYYDKIGNSYHLWMLLEYIYMCIIPMCKEPLFQTASLHALYWLI